MIIIKNSIDKDSECQRPPAREWLALRPNRIMICLLLLSLIDMITITIYYYYVFVVTICFVYDI